MSKVPDYVNTYMVLSKSIGHGYLFHRLVTELRVHPRIVNNIILNKPFPEGEEPDPILIKSILNKVSDEFNSGTLKPVVARCFMCGAIVNFQNEPRKIDPRCTNGYYLCDKCNF